MCCISDWSRNCSFTDEGLTLPVEGGRIICIGEVVVCNCCGVLIVEDALLSNAARVVCEKSLIASIIGLDAASDIFPKISTCSFNASFSSFLCAFTAYSVALRRLAHHVVKRIDDDNDDSYSSLTHWTQGYFCWFYFLLHLMLYQFQKVIEIDQLLQETT